MRYVLSTEASDGRLLARSLSFQLAPEVGTATNNNEM